MSAYDNDPRVMVWPDGDRTFFGPGGISYAAHPDDRVPNRWVVGPSSCPSDVARDDAKYREWADSLPRFDSLDAAIRSVIGDPR